LNNLTIRFIKKRLLLTPIEQYKNYLNQKIIKISNSQVISGPYKGTYLINKSHWSKFDYGSKLLGFYEEQIQNLIVDIQKKNDLKLFLNIGCGDGYHALGLVKNKFFEKSICYDISSEARNILEINIRKNNLYNKFIIKKEANIDEIKRDLETNDIQKTLFLIDIEGDEFTLFKDEDLNFLKKSFIIIEDHNFLIKEDKIKKNFYTSLNKYFNVRLIENGPRNPFKIQNDLIDQLNDDARFLLLSEGRPKKMRWIFLYPK
tara:strand:+ start:4324 stop:5103 length:780 start_codon:yes stop_codon:yes gene_type:complete